MNPEALLFGMLAVADFALLAHLRQRQERHARKERLRVSLSLAVRLENERETPYHSSPRR